MITRDILHIIDTFLGVVVKRNFPLLSVGSDWSVYLTRSSNENALYITNTGNVSVARWILPLVTIPLLDFVMIN